VIGTFIQVAPVQAMGGPSPMRPPRLSLGTSRLWQPRTVPKSTTLVLYWSEEMLKDDFVSYLCCWRFESLHFVSSRLLLFLESFLEGIDSSSYFRTLVVLNLLRLCDEPVFTSFEGRLMGITHSCCARGWETPLMQTRCALFFVRTLYKICYN